MGLHINVLRGKHDCTRGGLSSEFDTLTVVNAEGPFDPCPQYPAVMLHMHQKGCLRLVPVESVNGRWVVRGGRHHAMGGNFGHTSDSRFSELCEKLLGHGFYGAVAIHDRVE